MLTVTCPGCQAENALPRRHLLLRLDAGRVDSGEMLFTCLGCHVTATVEVGTREVATLVTAGVTHLSLSPPPSAHPAPHPEQPPGGPALTVDDLLDLHHLLDADDWLDEVVSPDR